ncbi:MAG: response regulator [Alphaproteobacteria bacterium]
MNGPASPQSLIAIVEDDPEIRSLSAGLFEREGFAVAQCADAAALDALLAHRRPALIVLDVMMPGESGLDLARSIRTGSNVPILMLTARTETVDRIAGLEIGADDYIGKPFEPRELLLRIGNILKRSEQADTRSIEIAHFGDFEFHLGSGDLIRAGKPVRITDREREMLRVLAARAGETVPRLALSAPGINSSERAVDVQINRLRRKIERDPTDPVYLRTVRGIGYQLIATP